MNLEPYTKFWPLIHSVIEEIWAIVEPHIEDAAIHNDVPVELYYYGELGLDHFSIEDFQKRDPFTNPEQFEKLFVRFDVKGWIQPDGDGRYLVTVRAHEGARKIIKTGDEYLVPFETFSDIDLNRLCSLLKQIVKANEFALEPPGKWAIEKRFRVADKQSPAIVQIREYLMDLFAYRDDSHLAASHPHFGQAGIVWSVLDSLWKNDSVTAEKMMESMSSRGYEVNDYEVALQAVVQIGWAEQTDIPGIFRITQKGRAVREGAEQLTNEYFYSPWSVMTQDELDELHDLLMKLRDQLNSFRKVK